MTAPQPLIVFSHANSFPAGTYRVLFEDLRARGYQVQAPEKFGHDPRYPVTSSWPHLVRELADFASGAAQGHAGPLYYVGHSLGGYLSLMAACQHPRPAQRAIDGVLLLDSPLVGGWKAALLGSVKAAGLAGRFAPGAISRRRRHHWPGEAQAHAHFAGKPAFAAWDRAVLHDYLRHGLRDHPAQPGRTLAFEREVETAIYNGLPHGMAGLLRRHPPPCPVAFIGGSRSRELRQVGLGLTRSVVGARIVMVEGSHLFPMERPHDTAAAIASSLQGLQPQAGAAQA